MGCHQTCPSLQELEICLVCVHAGGQDANMQAKEGALRENNLSSKLIIWKARTECGFHWSYLTDSETLRQRARLNMAELPVPSPLQRAWKQQWPEEWCWVGRGLCVGLQASVSLVCSCGRLRAHGPCPSLLQLQGGEPQTCCCLPRSAVEPLPFAASSVFLFQRHIA